jgi:hypothetical protein
MGSEVLSKRTALPDKGSPGDSGPVPGAFLEAFLLDSSSYHVTYLDTLTVISWCDSDTVLFFPTR